MKLSIIIPVFNEENTIKKVLLKVSSVKVFDWEKEIIVVDDASTDDTLGIIKKIKSEISFKLAIHGKNMGKGAAIRTALGSVSGEYVLIQDADLEYDPDEYEKLVLPIKEKKTEIVFGSRNISPKQRGYFLNYWGGKFLTSVVNLLFGSSLTDINTGYKIFKTGILKELNLRASRFDFCEEATVKALKAGHKIVEVPILYFPRKIKDGKKLRWIDGLAGFFSILRLKFLK